MTSSLTLSGRTALVTGSTSGIGAAIAVALAAQGAHVVLSGRDTVRGNAAVDAIRAAGGTAGFVAADLGGSYEELRAFAATAVEVLGGRLDLLVNNAGVYPSPATVDLSDDELDAMLAVNVRAPYVLAAALLPAMANRGSGAVVNGPRGVRVNTVAPGVTLTPGNAEFRAVLDELTASTPAGAVIEPSDIADAVVFLASDAAARVHGITLYVDGGISATKLS
jgi:NAD(P)-dependent dehydrogenase (short-subunit alcohol dehydrogenase family)